MSNHPASVHPRSMSLSQQHTVGVVINHYPHDDDDDICPVCDGECTCQKNCFPRSPIVINDHVTRHQPSTSQAPLPKPTLKIKLTVPQAMLSKRRATIQAESTSTNDNDQEDEDDDGASSSTSSLTPVKQHPTPPKRRGRPPKSAISARNAVSNQNAHRSSLTPNHLIKRKNVFVRHKKPPARSRRTKDNQSSAAAAAAIKRKVAARKHRAAQHIQTADSTDDDDDDNDYDHFPTFVSASALSSFCSSDSNISSSEQSDSEIEDEEERFIMAEVRDKARTRRELFGDDVQKRRDPHNNWVIRPRKKSDGEMDVDSDATEEDEQNGEDEEDEEDDDEETDGKNPGSGYIGLATGWSDDEESSFDADLFFTNLTDSDDRSGSSISSDDDQADQSDIDSVSVDVTDLLPHLRRGLENLPFEVAESWDGQIVFTNGLREGQGLLDIDFEIEAAQFMTEWSTPTPNSGGDTDVEMMHSDVDDGGYEQDADGGEGDTTDEELVGENDLPNERAMRLFNFPLSVSAINPLSTVSPGPRTRWSPDTKSPKPADILAGRLFWDSDDPEDAGNAGRGSASSKGAGPRRGSFVPSEGTRNVIIDDQHQEVPSPHPSFHRNKGKSAGRLSISSALTASIASSPVIDRSSPFMTSEDNGSLPPETPYEKPIELNDVLEASFLDPDPFEATSTDIKPFDKWDLVSVGAFRQTRETGTAVTEGASSWLPSSSPTDTITDYGKLVKPRPLDAMLWQNRSQRGHGRRGMNKIMDISPVILPRDGDQTPTNGHHNNYDHQPQKSRKELRRERKLKRKSAGPVRQQHQHHKHRHQNQHQQHYHHHHYPNTKSRSLASVQRINSANSSVPPLSL